MYQQLPGKKTSLQKRTVDHQRTILQAKHMSNNTEVLIVATKQLATTKGLHQFLEAAWLGSSRWTIRRGCLGRGTLLGDSRLLGQVLGAVLELSLSRTSWGGHVAETPNPAPPLGRQAAGGAWPISLLAHLLDRRRRRGLRGV